MTDSSTQGIKTVLHPVSDVGKAKPVYAALLGIPPQTDVLGLLQDSPEQPSAGS